MSGGRFTSFLVPFLDDGTYGEEVEVTGDIELKSISNIKQQLDQDDYRVGVLTYNDLNLKLRNEHGHYSDPLVPESIFRFKRDGVIFRLKWEIDAEPPYAGLAIAGRGRLSETKLLYEGFVEDSATRTNIRSQFTSLKVVGFESIVSKIEVPFADISNGDTLSDTLFTLLNQAAVTDLITVDALNITVGFDTTIDDKTSLESQTGKDALDEILRISNSVLYIKDRVLFITGRTPSATIKKNFYGPASIKGLENMQTISDIRTGLAKMFNFWTWRDETFNVKNPTSIARYKLKKKEVTSTLINVLAKQQAVLSALATEFGDPKESFRFKTPLDYSTIDLFFLDKINIDYPTVIFAAEGKELPMYGVSKYGVASYGIRESVLTISDTREFKILGINIDTQTQLLEINLTEV